MLYDFQRALLNLYTSESLLKDFERDPERVLAPFSLTEKERRAIRGLPVEQLGHFQKDLRGKRLGRTKMILKRTDYVVLMPFWKDSPALVWGAPEDPIVVPISVDIARLVRDIYAHRGVLSMTSLLGAYGRLGRASLGDLFRVAKLMYGRGLAGRSVFI
ncbi:hypothetical protein A2763_03880 [Candidatus Kaiserbacteria bacterium RIFCSPHIGHO2_01_FULL_54_36]|uniref:Uncharacterized protein n=1 Tax=Candidatus Kaiserbacteria bacterium RIFCSPHIGHO2_01_FULL_54_36 TaxID=1798482 RepID=A0A1F6CK90_9BACT|nr:MAG: hypothetical protein A2763_03880 [Candidatus Kaiserbacteria bacterium RIFCSPHIGHO2_01_FULL_54_36]OGG75620.1 MAG: hypothetical protein A3A41_00690 [Candidatus Kaiserbacteria bacterium RIFCSPLOWO2_01_FULL_54_22]